MAHWSIPRAPATTQVRPWCRSDDRCCSNKWRAVARSTSRDPVTLTNPARAIELSAPAEPANNHAASHDFIEDDGCWRFGLRSTIVVSLAHTDRARLGSGN